MPAEAARRSALRREQLAQRVLQDPAVPHVLPLARGVDADARPEAHRRAVVALGDDVGLAGLAVLEAGDRESLAAGEAEGGGVLARRVLERDDAHADEVRAVDPLVALRQRGAHAQELRPLRR